MVPSETLVFLVRHAEPAGPKGKRFLGWADPPLGPDGRTQARLLVPRLEYQLSGTVPGGPSPRRFDTAHSSDLARCMQTAEILVSGTDIQVTPHEWLREIDVGRWQGLTWEEAKQLHPDEYARRELDLVGHPFPGGESFRDLSDRVVPRFLDLIGEESRAGHTRVLVVAHKGVNRLLLGHFLGLPLGQIFSIGQEYCAVSILKASRGSEGELRLLAERST
jgi:probable phosphoglycerate mutase